jgi:hypothetical protein
VALVYRNKFVKFWNLNTREFSNSKINVTHTNERFTIKYIGKDKVLCIGEVDSRVVDLRVYYVENTGTPICKKKIERHANLGYLDSYLEDTFVIDSNTILYSFQDKRVHSFQLPNYNYSRMKTRRLPTIEGIISTHNHPRLFADGNLDNSPVKDTAYYKRLFDSIKDTKKRQSKRTHQERRRRTMASDTIKRGWKNSRRRRRTKNE